MRTAVLASLSFALSTSAAAGPIADQFAAGVDGISWGMNLDGLMAIRPGGDQYFSTSSGERAYVAANDEALFGVPRQGMRIQYHFGKNGQISSIAIGVPYERREQLLGTLLVLFGQHRRPVIEGTAVSYEWPVDGRMLIAVRASRDPHNGVLEFWVGPTKTRDR